MARNCPDCKEPMTTEKYRNVELDLCGECAGIWFDAEEYCAACSPPTHLLSRRWRRRFCPVSRRNTYGRAFFCVRPVRGCSTSTITSTIRRLKWKPVWTVAASGCRRANWTKSRNGATHITMSATEEEHKLIIAQATIEHENALHRLTNLHWFFGILRQHHPLWL